MRKNLSQSSAMAPPPNPADPARDHDPRAGRRRQGQQGDRPHPGHLGQHSGNPPSARLPEAGLPHAHAIRCQSTRTRLVAL